jgi:hypothetical protein
VKLDGAESFSNLAVSFARSSDGTDDVKPTWCRMP